MDERSSFPTLALLDYNDCNHRYEYQCDSKEPTKTTAEIENAGCLRPILNDDDLVERKESGRCGFIQTVYYCPDGTDFPINVRCIQWRERILIPTFAHFPVVSRIDETPCRGSRRG